MGEWSDFDTDTAPMGGGGDPFSDSFADSDPADTASTGTLPGGADGQLTPFSPRGGFDITDVLSGKFRNVNAQAPSPGGFWGTVRQLGRTYLDYTGRPAAALKRLLDGDVPAPGGGGGFTANPGLPDFGGGGGGAGARVQMILKSIRLRTGGVVDGYGHVHGGMRVTAKSLVRLIIRYGFPATLAMTGAPPADLLFLFFREKGTTHHRRGPGLYTVARKFRKYEALKRQCARVLGRGGHRVHHRRPHYNFHKRRRARR